MTIRDRVVATVKNWCGFGGFNTGTSLAVLWGQSSQAASIPFKPQAVSDLISKLQTEFSPPNPDARDLSSWNPNSFAPGGTIDAVDDLVSAVMFAPVPATVHAFRRIRTRWREVRDGECHCGRGCPPFETSQGWSQGQT